jgi:hypothetical protein
MNQLLEHKTVKWPDLPQDIPPSYGLSKRSDFRAKQVYALFLASWGFSVGVEIYTLLGWLFNRQYRNCAFSRALNSLVDLELITKKVIKIGGLRANLSLVHLTKRGRKLCHTFGWAPYESEWERMKRLHEKGKREPKHTCATLAFAYHARLRGYRSGVMPALETSGHFKPDAIVFEDGEPVLVEVELDYGKTLKWRNIAEHQGFAALCAPSAPHRNALKRECRSINVPGRATDLRTLFLAGKDDPPCPLWLDQWN